MKIVLQLLFALVLFSCSEKYNSSELLVRREACSRNISTNERIIFSMREMIEETGFRANDKRRLAECHKIADLRKDFMRSQTKESLLLYSDSIEARYKKQKENRKELLSSINELRKQVRESEDSLLYYNLLHLTTVAEGELIETHAAKVGAYVISCDFSFTIPLLLDKKVYEIKEPVILTLYAKEKSYPNTEFDFSGVTCKRNGSDITLKPFIKKSGPHYILLFFPSEIGSYIISGEITLKQEGNVQSNFTVIHEFEVMRTQLSSI
ncbi:hypothetical protein [Rufibacter roseus]|uniref:Lipoprotein n=1 Tax=Rufibacter roseus TaxID=1567108 RepID=A0ABW2DK16_9BACT|nr:hypothetical protein [Rufibacter roseus]